MTITLHPIGYIHSPYKEKFAIPRQPGLATAAKGRIELVKPYCQADYCRGLEQFSHLWLIFQFHQTADKTHSALARPPRLGGNEKIGVFATRNTHRPNNLGMSVVKLESVDIVQNNVEIIVSGIDLLDGTPIIDIKPYLPYADALPDAMAGYAQQAPENLLQVAFSQQAQQQIQHYCAAYPELHLLISQIMAQDPRPAYQRNTSSERVYGVKLYEFNVRWQVNLDTCTVIEVSPV
ncbi:tRNA (N6-threonylcarbamoyladenosine(37)-N6)-methyltransferase TrmO [Aliiglaciecola sp. LCG003]|uniref:tRNA (N6-threonylcarbamoyladenosine(37)-N6)-methyltransferase TrmO n=1 Tax=Aliiglaciecola sp. LCG003 TaxID=3053655 RepID=UPI00257314D6|nr:tRNA (N6-threonylcarbamoyladenosine(37)-N6)-methyltransferase TrmO [Aliiglaciecola sp. LCG003]WJG08515.1 tRNA (N6-threonylcarbamoyladenosine(37)-N6)-methyltransferase TrmO [Aliiglaciecola sp. LCG003]